MPLGIPKSAWAPWPLSPLSPLSSLSIEDPSLHVPLDVHVSQQLAGVSAWVSLLGSAQAGPRGRWGLVGVPGRIQTFQQISTSTLDQIFNHPPLDTWRVVALGYEGGACCMALPSADLLHRGPAAVVLDLAGLILVDHTQHSYALLGPHPAARRMLEATLTAPPPPRRPPGKARLKPAQPSSVYRRCFQTLQAHIAAGDVYQANLTRRLNLQGHVDALGLFIELARYNPVPHAAYLRIPGIEMVSNSMETLLTFDPHTRQAESYPIKGTYPRPCPRPWDPHSPERGDMALLSSPKDHAEHVMIVDVVRNDLGKVCTPGTVHVRCLMHAEPYAGLWHGVSRIEGTLHPSRSLGCLVAAVFPGGSITGAPKRRATELLRMLEIGPRGFYTGALGFVTPQGHASLSILIRTLVRDAQGWHLGVGGGIVADSSVEGELQETWQKVHIFRHLLCS